MHHVFFCICYEDFLDLFVTFKKVSAAGTTGVGNGSLIDLKQQHRYHQKESKH